MHELAKGAAPVIVAASIPLFSTAVELIKNSYYEYSAENLEEMQQIQQAYRYYCFPHEKPSSLNTLRLPDEKNEGVKKEADQAALPIYFEMDREKKRPTLFERGFIPNKKLHDWLIFLNRKSYLTHYIEEMLGYICECQCARDTGYFEVFKSGFNYDPTNLFFEEFKRWLIELSKCSLNDDVLKIIEGRIDYLEELINSNVFKAAKEVPSRPMTLSYLKEILEEGIKPLIELAIYRQSAREHFNDLKLSIYSTIKNTVRFLFYIFRDTKGAPQNFILEQIGNPRFPSYKSCIDTATGKLLRLLVNSPAFSMVFKPLDGGLVQRESTLKAITTCTFIDEKDKAVYPYTAISSTSRQWYEDNSGILSVFQHNPVTMEKFLRLHGELQQLCVFYIICDLIFELAGEGGDLMVYGYAAKEVTRAIQKCDILVTKIRENIGSLYLEAKRHKDNILRQVIEKPSDADLIWEEYYAFAVKAKKEFEHNVKSYDELSKTVHSRISRVRSPEYIEWVKQRLNLFLTLVDQFAQPTHAIENTRSLTRHRSGDILTHPSLKSAARASSPTRGQGVFDTPTEPAVRDIPRENPGVRSANQELDDLNTDIDTLLKTAAKGSPKGNKR